MRMRRSGAFLVVLGLLGVLMTASPAQAVEYRLQVVSMWDSGFNSFVKAGELGDGASGPGLDALVASLDRGETPRGPLLSDRTVQRVRQTVARAYGTGRVRAEITPGGEDKQRWDEVRWDGKAGERSVWVIAPSGRGRPQELYHVVLQGTGPLRHFTPYAPRDGHKLPVVKYPLDFLWFHEERGTLREKYLSQSLDLSQGIGVVAGSNPNPTFPDQVYLVVNQAEQPTTYKAVLVWREPPSNLEAPAPPRPAPR
jgi:hypothetical protein